MAKKKPEDGLAASQKVRWIKHLPKEGGAWGQAIVQSVDAFEAQAEEMESELANATAEHERAVAALTTRFAEREGRLTTSIKARRKLADDAVKRATKEVSMLFADAQISQAQAQAADEIRREQAAAERKAAAAQSGEAARDDDAQTQAS